MDTHVGKIVWYVQEFPYNDPIDLLVIANDGETIVGEHWDGTRMEVPAAECRPANAVQARVYWQNAHQLGSKSKVPICSSAAAPPLD